MTSRDPSPTPGPRRRSRLIGLAVHAAACLLACTVTAPAQAATAPAGRRLQNCGWNEAAQGEHAYYEHCATDTDVWIQVTRLFRGKYHRCVGPGRTNLDADATGAWYDSTYRGGLCSHPGDTGP
ncbi:DUF6355 family natural product biosynthesis protein [Streptomyces sp. NPDC021356]|uniref:DUF6355 family natural product biosynthesis protein n=1 Tax=Streptomyces sp. NPDC021356 TaxID=3154900 RepID=UPI0033E21A58